MIGHLLCLLNFLVLVSAVEYFVDVDSLGGTCDDTNTGTKTEPFCTIDEGMDRVVPGDTVFVRKGTYEENLAPPNGNSTHIVTVKQYDSQKPLLIGHDYGCVSVGDYVIADGFRCEVDIVKFHSDYGWIGIMVYGDHSIVRNCEVINPAGSSLSWRIDGNDDRMIGGKFRGKYSIIENCVFDELSVYGIGFDDADEVEDVPQYNIARGNKITNFWLNCFEIGPNLEVMTGNIIEDNYCEGSLISDGVQSNSYDLTATYCRGYIIRNNIFYSFAENCMDMKGAKFILFENNICSGVIGDNDGYYGDMTHDRNTGGAFGRGSSTTAENVIVRNNIIYDNAGGGWGYDDWAIYNNIIHNNNRDYTGPNSDAPEATYTGLYSAGNTLNKNNFMSHQNENLVYYRDKTEGGGPYPHLTTDYNAYMSKLSQETSNSSIFQFRQGKNPTLVNEYLNWEEWRQFLQTNDIASEHVTGKDENSFRIMTSEFGSVFRNVDLSAYGKHTKYDFRNQQNSPLLEQGGPLTITTGSGSTSNSLIVDESAYFFDGYGNVDVEGDTIIIASPGGGWSGRKEAVIESIDYDSNTITLDRSLSWSEGDWVNLKSNYFYYDEGDQGQDFPNNAPSIGTTLFDDILGKPPYFGGEDDPVDPGDDIIDDDSFGNGIILFFYLVVLVLIV